MFQLKVLKVLRLLEGTMTHFTSIINFNLSIWQQKSKTILTTILAIVLINNIICQIFN